MGGGPNFLFGGGGGGKINFGWGHIFWGGGEGGGIKQNTPKRNTSSAMCALSIHITLAPTQIYICKDLP